MKSKFASVLATVVITVVLLGAILWEALAVDYSDVQIDED